MNKEAFDICDNTDSLLGPMFAQVLQATYVVIPTLVDAWKKDQPDQFTDNDSDFLAWLAQISQENKLIFLGVLHYMLAVVPAGPENTINQESTPN